LLEAEKEAPNPEIAARYRQALGGIAVPAESLEDEHLEKARAEFRQRMEETVTHKNHKIMSPLNAVRSANIFDSIQDRAEREAKTVEFVKEMKEEFPPLYPYLLMATLAEGRMTNSWLKSELEKVATELKTAPTNVFRPEHFYSLSLEWRALTFFESDPALGLQLIQLKEDAAKKGLCAGLTDESKLAKGFGLMKQENWKEALEVFDSLGNRILSLNRPGPWGCDTECPIPARRLAAQCRGFLGLAPDRSGFFQELTKPLFESKEPLVMAADAGEVWIANSKGIWQFDPAGQPLRKVAFKPASPPSSMALGKDYVYLGSDGDGIVQAHRRTFQTREFRMADGLLSGHIADLKLIGENLWIGFGQRPTSQMFREQRYAGKSGGAGVLDVATGKIRSFPFSAAKPAALADAPTYESPAVRLEYDRLPPNETVLAIEGGPDARIHMAALSGGLRDFEPRSNRWGAVRFHDTQRVTSLAVSKDYLCAGQNETEVQNTAERGKTIWIRGPGDKEFKFISVADGLPNQKVTALLLDEKTLWVGGFGYVAALNLEDHKITRLVSLPVEAVTKLILAEKRLWIAADAAVYLIPL
jgi:hypothetical protein